MQNEKALSGIFEKDAFKGEALFNEPMERHTTLKIGGPAEVFAMPEDIFSLKNILSGLNAGHIPFMPVGSGSNILVSDNGVAGAVISVAAMKRIEVINEDKNEVRLFVEAGLPLQRLVNLAREKGYEGIEGLTGIPGTLGGAIRGNAGSFGYEIGNVIESLAVLDGGNNLKVIEREALNFRYRASSLPEECIILSANIIFKKGDVREITERTAGFIKEKSAKQPLSERSAGCVFKNPKVEGVYAGRLIEEAHCKGMKIGAVEVSAMHANFFINRGHGTASDFVSLMGAVKEKVINSSGIELEAEIRIVGKK